MTWPNANFLDVVRDVSGGNLKIPKSAYQGSGSIPVIDQGQSPIAGYTDDPSFAFKSAELPVVIFGDHTRALKFADSKFAMGADGVKVLKPSDDCDARYLYHYLRQANLPDAGYSRHYKFLKELKIPLPPLPEQRRIASILDKADALRAKRREAIAKCDQLLQSVFLDMFGDPVTNPKGWPIENLGDVCNVRDGTHDSPKYVADGYPLVTSKNLVSGRVDLEGAMLISAEDYEQVNRRSKVSQGDILMPMIGTIGNPVLVDHEPNYAIKNIALLRFTGASISNVYVLHLLQSHFFDWYTSQRNRGGTQKFLALGAIRGMPIPVPDHLTQEAFEERFSALQSQMQQLEDAERRADELFMSAQQRAFSGQLSPAA